MQPLLNAKLYKGLVLLILLAGISSCTFHSYFPFICFRKGCVNSSINLKGFKKRLKGEWSAKKRKKGKKPKAAASSNAPSDKSSNSSEGNDSVAMFGKKVDYYRYLLLFRLKKDPTSLDSLVIEHTSETKDITELDQTRLSYKLDTLPVRNIITVYIKNFYSKTKADDEHPHVARSRVNAIRRFLHHQGVPLPHIKILQDSLSPPRL